MGGLDKPRHEANSQERPASVWSGQVARFLACGEFSGETRKLTADTVCCLCSACLCSATLAVVAPLANVRLVVHNVVDHCPGDIQTQKPPRADSWIRAFVLVSKGSIPGQGHVQVLAIWVENGGAH